MIEHPEGTAVSGRSAIGERGGNPGVGSVLSDPGDGVPVSEEYAAAFAGVQEQLPAGNTYEVDVTPTRSASPVTSTR